MPNSPSTSFTIQYEHPVNEIQTDCSISSMNDRAFGMETVQSRMDTWRHKQLIATLLKGASQREVLPKSQKSSNGPPFANTYMVRIKLPNDLEFHNILRHNAASSPTMTYDVLNRHGS